MNWGEFLYTNVWQLIAMLALLICSGFFSGSETALFSLTRSQLSRIKQTRSSRRVAAMLVAKPRRLLNTLLLSNMLVNVSFAAASALMVIKLKNLGASALVMAAASVAPLLLLILVGEVTPKMLAYASRERWAVATATGVLIVSKALLPVLWVLENTFISPLVRIIAPRPAGGADITSGQLAGMLDLSAKRGIISRDAGALLQEIVDLTDLRVADIMVPRVDMEAHDINAPRTSLEAALRRTRLRRIPVYDGDVDHILGIIHAKRVLLNPRAAMGELIEPAVFLPEQGNIERALVQFRARRVSMAVVVDEYGGTAGLVTLKDILEEIVGDIPEAEQTSPGPTVEDIGDNEYLIEGDLAIHEWVDEFKMDLTGKRISTVGGFVTSLLGRIPGVGDRVEYRNLTFTVESMRGRRVGKVTLKLLEQQQ